MTYKNFPVYIGYGNRTFSSNYGFYRNFMIFANSVNVSYSSASAPNRRIGSDIDRGNQYYYTNNLTCRISLDFTIYSKISQTNTPDSVYGFLVDKGTYENNIVGNNTGKNYFPIRIGSNLYNKSYLDEYSVNVSAFSPIRITAGFTCYDPPENEALSSEQNTSFQDYSDLMNGMQIVTADTCELSGFYDQVVSASIVPTMTFAKRYSRTPVYTLGSSKPSSFLLDAVESNMVLNSTGLNNFSDYKGIKLQNNIGLTIKDINGEFILPSYDGGFNFGCHSGAKVNNYSYSIAGGDVVNSTATIQEVLI